MRAGRWQEPVAVALVSAAFVATALAPLALLAVDAVRAPDLGPLGSSALWWLFARTAASAGAVTLLALAIGVPMGLALARSDAAGRAPALVLHVFPLFLPPLLLALGWFHVLGEAGIAGSAATSRALFSSAGAIAVMASALTPVVTLMTLFGLDGIDPSLEEAARIASGPRRVALRILLPLAWPSAAVGGLVVFALAFGELGVPIFLRVPAYPAAVFARLGGLDYAPGEAFTLTAPLLGLALLLLAAERAIRRGRI
ncbi:MAG TPA: ABC transporter permease subunit, partial [Candidatus Acidoferrum sp.]|nr:ABC transporter permease subunit [Candidatus Acidoferrum sp.]